MGELRAKEISATEANKPRCAWIFAVRMDDGHFDGIIFVTVISLKDLIGSNLLIHSTALNLIAP